MRTVQDKQGVHRRTVRRNDMVKIERNFTVRKTIIDLLRSDRFPITTHTISRLVCCPRKTYWHRSGINPEYEDETILTFTRGKGHHGVLEVYELKEVEKWKDGIRGDIDMIGDRVTEIFTTTLGLKRDWNPTYIFQKFPLKVLQLMAYLYMNDTTEGDLIVFYLMGDYTRPIKPELEVYTISTDYVETKGIWDSPILENRSIIDTALKDNICPLKKGEPFECLNCSYDYLCQEFEKYSVKLV